jgi:hypothetical protein
VGKGFEAASKARRAGFEAHSRVAGAGAGSAANDNRAVVKSAGAKSPETLERRLQNAAV